MVLLPGVIEMVFFFFRGDIVNVETWVGPSGKNGMFRDWHVQDFNSGQTILRATRLAFISLLLTLVHHLP